MLSKALTLLKLYRPFKFSTLQIDFYLFIDFLGLSKPLMSLKLISFVFSTNSFFTVELNYLSFMLLVLNMLNY